MTESRARILLVDDHPENLLALEAILDSLDQTLVSVGSGEEALRALLRDDYALILLDAQMPGMDGFETASRIKSRTRTKDVPIIFLTAADKEQRNSYRGYAVGGADYITKPFDPWILRAKVQVFVDLWAAGRRLERQAEMLRRSLDDGAADVHGALRDHVGEVVAATEALESSVAEASQEVHDAVLRLRREVDALRDALTAMQSGGAAAGVTRRQFG